MSMNAASQPSDAARLDRALDRLAEHCELYSRRNAAIEERRATVRERLDRELGPELASILLAGLSQVA